MKPGRGSRTAELVCMGRAVADRLPPVPRFADPTAFSLLPRSAQERVERAASPSEPRGFRARFDRGYLRRQSKLMALRTVAIDDAVRAAGLPQLVILGAGLDGRAWRMPELASTVVFEVDHPDSQRNKRARLGSLTQCAGEVRFLAVDFTHDSLDQALARAGHDPARPTTWLWEGVVMYLTPKEVAATLAVILRRSAPGSHLNITYAAPALMFKLVGLVVSRMGEPFRSAFTPAEMRALLERHGFGATSDHGLAELGARTAPELARAMKVANHLRIVSAVHR